MKLKLLFVLALFVTLVSAITLCACGEAAPTMQVFIRYSAFSDGAAFTETWTEGQNYMGVAIAEEAPADETQYTWSKFVGNDGEDGTSESVFVRYSANADGTDFTETWTLGQKYIGIATGTTAPVDKSGYSWSLFSTAQAETKSIKILAIGNSFSSDATEFLWGFYNAAGYDEVVVGNMYIGGCSIDMHWSNMQSNAPSYEYYKMTDGSWAMQNFTDLVTAIEDERWDVITVQQVSGLSGEPTSFGNLNNVLSYVNAHKTNPDVKIYYHMTWAYQSDSNHIDFQRYESNQILMYNSIVNATQTQANANPMIDGIIPAGTAIQNMRTGALGDWLTRDGYHLSRYIGRYIAAMTWYATLSGESVAALDYVINAGFETDLLIELMPSIKESVKNAVERPFQITNVTDAAYPYDEMEASVLDELDDADIAFLTEQGKDATKYKKLRLEWKVGAYYNSTDNIHRSETNGKASNSPYFLASQLISIDQLPVGTIFSLAEGYEYRPEGWTAYNTYQTASRRPETVTRAVDDIYDTSWHYIFQIRAFNLSKTSGEAMTAEDGSALNIYVPV